ncbi:unnamed protein product [Gongylonema pulchrum]|uniref:Secreted protein n=1 Tax=Gongylonema pulchrum TaxID=637853 RepID=A0A183DTR7_9BILA|nr:unnamed protein product [Gongylonema pulchrum]
MKPLAVRLLQLTLQMFDVSFYGILPTLLAAHLRKQLASIFSALLGLQKALHAGAVVGLMCAFGNTGSSLTSAEINARKEGIQIREEPCAAKELIVVAGTRSVSGYAAPSGTVISAFNSCKSPVPLMASGTFIIDFLDSGPLEISDDVIKVIFMRFALCNSSTKRILSRGCPCVYLSLCVSVCVRVCFVPHFQLENHKN